MDSKNSKSSRKSVVTFGGNRLLRANLDLHCYVIASCLKGGLNRMKKRFFASILFIFHLKAAFIVCGARRAAAAAAIEKIDID